MQIRKKSSQNTEKLKLATDVECLSLSLSDGEGAKLNLWTLFQLDAQRLVLNEPSNQLGKSGKH